MTDSAVVKEFLIESYEGLDQLDREFVGLEANPGSRERIAVIFRIIHTIKGTCGFLAYSRLEQLTHAGESLLSVLRDGGGELDAEKIQALLTMVDAIRATLASIENTGREPERDDSALIDRFLAWSAEARGEKAEAASAAAKALEGAHDATAEELKASVPKQAADRSPAPPPAPPPASPPVPPPAPPPAASAPKPANPSEMASESTTSAVSDSNVRVDVGLLDTLMNLVGELVLARNQILQIGALSEDAGLISASQRLNLVTAELQGHVMKTRMQPIGNVWGKLPRVVRDLAVMCGKQVRVEMAGRDTELDKTIIEAIKDPLTHIVRNAIDHGIESPDARAAKGKPRTGTLSLRAFHEGGQVNIEIADDGAGLVLDAIRRKAVERQVVSADRASRMSDHELAQLIFLPGFSTAPKVTNVSGRGVGMDVVKTNIERIGGTVELLSREGLGTTIKIKIPLTLAIVPALVVIGGGQRYAIPQANLLELVRLEGKDGVSGIETVRGCQVYRLRGQLLPIVHLGRALGQEVPSTTTDDTQNIIVLSADGQQFGLLVDDVGDTEEIVVKPLVKQLKALSVFAGATIMGDGRIALILDAKGLAQHARAGGRQAQSVEAKPAVATPEAAASSATNQALIVFGAGETSTMAMPLSLVARLEEFPKDKLERSSSGWVVQHRGRILPLIDVADLLHLGSAGAEGNVPVIVYAEGDKHVGFIVDRLIDVVDDVVAVERCGAKPGVLGAAIVHGRVTDLLDVQGIVKTHAPWFAQEAWQ